jgi:putative transcriptional regulator
MSSDTIDTLDALLARYVAGTLPLPAHVLVAAHLELKPENRRFVAGLEKLAGEELEGLDPIPLSVRTRRLESIFASESPSIELVRSGSDDIFPGALRSFVGFDSTAVPWRRKLPGFRECEIGDIDGCHASLFWLRPGRKIPAHTHEGLELTLVLDGAFRDNRGRYGRGDISLADPRVDHRPIAENERPCIGFAVTDAPLKLTGSLGQRLSDILGA